MTSPTEPSPEQLALAFLHDRPVAFFGKAAAQEFAIALLADIESGGDAERARLQRFWRTRPLEAFLLLNALPKRGQTPEVQAALAVLAPGNRLYAEGRGLVMNFGELRKKGPSDLRPQGELDRAALRWIDMKADGIPASETPITYAEYSAFVIVMQQLPAIAADLFTQMQVAIAGLDDDERHELLKPNSGSMVGSTSKVMDTNAHTGIVALYKAEITIRDALAGDAEAKAALLFELGRNNVNHGVRLYAQPTICKRLSEDADLARFAVVTQGAARYDTIKSAVERLAAGLRSTPPDETAIHAGVKVLRMHPVDMREVLFQDRDVFVAFDEACKADPLLTVDGLLPTSPRETQDLQEHHDVEVVHYVTQAQGVALEMRGLA